MELQTRSGILLVIFFGISLLIWPEREKDKFTPSEEVFSYPPVNLAATRETKDLLKLLYYLKGRYTLSGQHNYLEEPEIDTIRVERLVGDSPALHGYEFGAILNQSDELIQEQRQRVVDSAIQAHHDGEVVALTYHAQMPGECACWEYVNNGGISEARFKEIITPGTDMYKELLADLDDVAVYLKKLQDAKVPVLWRPYQEMNGGWFWWGEQPEFAQLWEIMFERFTKHHKLNNLLWVWSPGAPNEYAGAFEPYYVGPLRADILAVDIYDGEFEQSHHDQLWVLGGGKPIAIGENGHLPDPELLNLTQRQYIWFMTWADELINNNENRVIKELYGDEKVLTLKEFQTLKETMNSTSVPN